MRLSDFDTIYGHDRSPAPNYYRDESMHNLAQDMRQHALPFQEITATYVGGDIPDTNDILHEATLYEKWAQHEFSRDFGAIIKRLSIPDALSPALETELKDLIAETAFVLMNTAMAGNWLSLATTKPQSRESIHRTQIQLALGNILPAKSREAMIRDETFFDKVSCVESGNEPHEHIMYEPNPVASSMSGAANEIDSALIAHEASMLDPNIVILPAPGYFENGVPHRLNADLFAVHTLRRQIAPIQVKSSLSRSTVDSYHPTMTFIDGSNDLLNIRSIRLPGKSTALRVPWGGLISIHTIAAEKNLYRIDTAKGKAFRPNGQHRMLLQARQAAKQLAKTAKSHNREAATTISSRINHALDDADASPDII